MVKQAQAGEGDMMDRMAVNDRRCIPLLSPEEDHRCGGRVLFVYAPNAYNFPKVDDVLIGGKRRKTRTNII